MTGEDKRSGFTKSAGSGDSNLLGLPWPDSYQEIQPLIQKHWEIEGGLYLSRRLSGGKSGALVFAADIESKEFTGQAILKLDEFWDSSQKEQDEANRHRLALSEAPEFATRHLPRLLHTLHHNHQLAVLSTIAGRGLQYAKSWNDCTFETQSKVIRQVSHDLLEDWNRDYRRAQGMRHPNELLRSWLDYRLDPENGGRIHAFLSDRCGIPPDVPSITFEGHWYPNPLAFALDVVPLPDHLRIRLISGRLHGDLHAQNLLVTPKSDEPSYYLIDLAFYQNDQYLFFDHAYFETAFLVNSRLNARASDWASIVSRLRLDRIKDQSGDARTDDIGLIELIRTLRLEVTNWVDRHEPDRLPDMESQYILARVATGLNFTHKNIPEPARRKAFIYAAANLKDFLKLNGVDWPKHGPLFPFEESQQQQNEFVETAKIASPPVSNVPAPRPAPAVAANVEEATQTGSSEGRLKRLINELRRRHVIRVAGLYLVVAWLCVQVAAAAKSTLLLPDWTDTLVTVLLAIGFPVTCVIAWAFELSPGGLQQTRPVRPGDSYTIPKRGFIDYLIVAGIAALVVVTVAGYDFRNSGGAPSSSVATGEQPSIAVLPFRNLSADGTDDSFSDGLTIEILATLARSGKLRVVGQSSTFKYKDHSEDLREIGRALGVRYLLEGSVRRVDNDVRVESQLIEANDGFLVWSDVFSDQVDDIFVIQEKIANAIGTALETPIGINASGLESGRTGNREAYDLFLRALALSGEQGAGARGQIAEAIDLLSKAVEVDPNFAAGWAGLALAYDLGVVFRSPIDGRLLSPSVYIRRAADAALKARELNPDLAIVQHAMGNVHRRARQWSTSEEYYRNALKLEPNNVLALTDYARMLAMVGYFEEAMAMTERVGQLDPRNPTYNFTHTLYAVQADPTPANFEQHLEGFGNEPNFAPFVLRSTMGYLFESNQVDRLKKLVSDCDRCNAGWRERTQALVDAVGKETPEKIYDDYKLSRALGYPLLDYMSGPQLVLQAFSDNTNDRSFNFQAFLVPWIEIEKIGQSETFRSLINDLGLDDYWRQRGWPDHCAPIDDTDFECGSNQS